MTHVERAIAVCKRFPQGASQENLEHELGLGQQECLDLVNRLLKHNHIEAHLRADQTVIFKEKDSTQALRLKGLTPEDLLVLQAIEKTGSQGIWTKDMKRATNLVQQHITKILKTLESRKLVKPVQSVNEGKRKIYVLYDIEPAEELTGGLWFAGAEMDLEFISVMQQHCKTILRNRGTATTQQILDMLEYAKVANVKLDIASIETLLKTLQAACEVERVPTNLMAWRLMRQAIPARNSFTARPCGVCPVIDECNPGGSISPETCVYFDQYLTW